MAPLVGLADLQWKIVSAPQDTEFLGKWHLNFHSLAAPRERISKRDPFERQKSKDALGSLVGQTGVGGHLPVLMVFLMMVATWPLSTELKSLTIMIRQPQRTSRERTSRMMPTARSGRSKFAKMC